MPQPLPRRPDPGDDPHLVAPDAREGREPDSIIAAPSGPHAPEPVVILLDDRNLEHASRIEAVQQGAAAIVLLLAAYHRYAESGGRASVFVALLFIVGLVLLTAAIGELRGRGSARIGSLNVVAGVALLTEWGVSMAAGAKTIQPSLLAAIVSLGLGIFHAPIQRARRRRRHVTIDVEGIALWLSPFRRFRVRWADLRRVEMDSATLRLVRENGKLHRIPVRRLHNAAEVAAAIVDACRSRNIEIRTLGAHPSRRLDVR